MKALLIGGPSDGMRLVVPTGTKFIRRVEYLNMPATFENEDSSLVRPACRFHEYRLAEVYTETGVIAGVFQHEDDQHSAVMRLVEGYRPEGSGR